MKEMRDMVMVKPHFLMAIHMRACTRTASDTARGYTGNSLSAVIIQVFYFL